MEFPLGIQFYFSFLMSVVFFFFYKAQPKTKILMNMDMDLDDETDETLKMCYECPSNVQSKQNIQIVKFVIEEHKILFEVVEN